MYKVIIACLCASVLFSVSSCKKTAQSTAEKVNTTLYDKSLEEIKRLINGKWELVEGQNARETNEFENTFIEFNNDNYVWTEDGTAEPGKLNWRKAQVGSGYEAYLMDVFYAEYPSYPLAIKGDTLYIKDCTETAYKYTLVRRKK